MRRETREACFSRLSHTHLFLLSYSLCLVYLCLSCVLGYGWKRLDFYMVISVHGIFVLCTHVMVGRS